MIFLILFLLMRQSTRGSPPFKLRNKQDKKTLAGAGRLTSTKTVQEFNRVVEERLRLLNRSTNSRETDSTRGYEFEEMENNSDAISLVPTNFACCWI